MIFVTLLKNFFFLLFFFHKFLKTLPVSLRAELSSIMFISYVEGICFFKRHSKKILASVGPHLRPQKISINDIIFHDGEYANEMYFLKKGQVSLTLRKFNYFPFITINEGYYFGEVKNIMNELKS